MEEKLLVLMKQIIRETGVKKTEEELLAILKEKAESSIRNSSKPLQ